MTRSVVAIRYLPLLALIGISATGCSSGNGSNQTSHEDSTNGAGISRTLTSYAGFDRSNPFFNAIGQNGRTCATCHPLSQGMTISPHYVTQIFNQSQGLDPLFAAVDGANSPTCDLSTSAKRQTNCSMLLTKGLIRIGLPIPNSADFTLASVDDPYQYASAQEISCFRRPLAATDLRFVSSVMWDGRELAPGRTLNEALASQIRDAVATHMQGKTPLSDTVVAQIVDFETHLYTSQVYDNGAGNLDGYGTLAGPDGLVNLSFNPGTNSAFGLGLASIASQRGTQALFNPNVFAFYAGWLGGKPQGGAALQAQQSIARGEQLFNTRQFVISGVAGFNDVTGKSNIMGTCSSCHNTPGVGSNSVPALMNIGTSDGAIRTPDMPLYTFQNRFNRATIQTTDPGAALITGRWSDIGKFKVPVLRGLAGRPPYMHNGLSPDLVSLVSFYDSRFKIGLTSQEKSDLQAFLAAL